MVLPLAAGSLDRSVEETVRACRRALRKHYGPGLAGLLLYGSAVHGALHAESDIDLLVILSERFEYFEELRTIIEVLEPVQLASERLISARPAALDEVEKGSLYLYRTAVEEGVRL